MRIEQLVYFLEVAKTGSINKAAENLFVTQPGLGDALKKLEQELNLTLLNRSKRGVTLTNDGKLVAKHTLNILSAYQEMMVDLRKIESPSQPPPQNITIATTPLFASSMLMDSISLLQQTHPHIHIRYMEMLDFEVINSVQKGEAEFGFIATKTASTELPISTKLNSINSIPLFNDELVVCLAKSSKRAFSQSFSQDIVNSEKLVIFSSTMTNQAQHPLAISNNILSQIELILQNDAFTVLPKSTFERRYSSNPGLIFRPISPKVYTHFALIHQANLSPDQLEHRTLLMTRLGKLLSSYPTVQSTYHLQQIMA